MDGANVHRTGADGGIMKTAMCSYLILTKLIFFEFLLDSTFVAKVVGAKKERI